MQKAFYEAQEKGQIPEDEPFDPFFLDVLDTDHTYQKRYPFQLAMEARLKVKQYYDDGMLCSPRSSGYIGIDANGVMRGAEYIFVDGKRGVYVESAMRLQNFPVMISDIFDEILMLLLFDKIEKTMRNECQNMMAQDIDSALKRLQNDTELLRTHLFSNG